MNSKSSVQSTKSFSLPKLAQYTTLATQNSHKRPLKQIHKVNWSVAPKCLLEGHEGQPVIYVCVKKQCDCATRLVCQKCFYGGHVNHNTYFMAVDEVKAGKIGHLRYWPFQSQSKTIFQFIKSHNSYVENLILDIKASFDNLLQSVIRSIQQAKQKYIQKVQKFYTKQTKKQQYINQLTTDLQKYFNFKQIQVCVRQCFNKQVRHDIFLKKMNGIMKDKSNQQPLQKMIKDFYDHNIYKGKDMRFDKIYFLKKQKIIIRNINELQNSIMQQQVSIDQASVGVENIIVQTVQYLKTNSEGLYPLTYDEKKLEDGTQYTGFLWKGYRTLLGLRDYKNGYKYYGQWKNNCRNGWGVYENKQISYKYAGNWKQDKKNGFGKQSTATYMYEGNFLNDKKDGFGSIRQDGIRFDITWKNDKKNGKGKKIDAEGEQTQVYFLNGVESLVKGAASGGLDGQKRDVNFLARMFANGAGSP